MVDVKSDIHPTGSSPPQPTANVGWMTLHPSTANERIIVGPCPCSVVRYGGCKRRHPPYGLIAAAADGQSAT